MTLTVVWSIQARNQFIATLAYIAHEDPLTDNDKSRFLPKGTPTGS